MSMFKFRKSKKVYVVVGTHYSTDSGLSYSSLSEYGVLSTLKKAKRELDYILADIKEDADWKDYDFNVRYDDSKTKMYIYYSFGDEDEYEIHERIIDF